MSADNGIYILQTTDSRKDCKFGKEKLEQKSVAYRVDHCQAIDNFDWYIKNEIHNLGGRMSQEFGESKIFYDYSEALKEAESQENKIGWTEYGIQTVDARKYNFPGY